MWHMLCTYDICKVFMFFQDIEHMFLIFLCIGAEIFEIHVMYDLLVWYLQT